MEMDVCSSEQQGEIVPEKMGQSTMIWLDMGQWWWMKAPMIRLIGIKCKYKLNWENS